LKTKQKELELQDKGNKPKRACPPTDEESKKLFVWYICTANVLIAG
jgi:hypothetical protein